MKGLISREQTDFQLKSTFWLSLTGGSLIVIIAIVHLTLQNWQIGTGAIIIGLGLFLGTWTCYKKTYNSIYTFLLLTPFSTMYVAYLTNSVGISATFWCYPTVLLFYFMMSERQAWVSNIVFVVTILPLSWFLLERHEVIRLSGTLILVSAYAAIFLRVISKLYSERCQQATTDALTGLYNRTLLEDFLEQAIHQANRTDSTYTLISMDIDFFKKINDELGHDIGDHVLVELGSFLKGFFRESDKVFRTGGEEFLILLSNTNEASSIEMAEKLRKEVESLPLIPLRKVTVSIGISSSGEEEDWKAWMKRCDKNLYKAKNNGRNQVVSCMT